MQCIAVDKASKEMSNGKKGETAVRDEVTLNYSCKIVPSLFASASLLPFDDKIVNIQRCTFGMQCQRTLAIPPHITGPRSKLILASQRLIREG